jgi:hypothetical protein
MPGHSLDTRAARAISVGADSRLPIRDWIMGWFLSAARR